MLSPQVEDKEVRSPLNDETKILIETETKFSETETETFFPKSNSPKPTLFLQDQILWDQNRYFFRDQILRSRNRDFFLRDQIRWTNTKTLQKLAESPEAETKTDFWGNFFLPISTFFLFSNFWIGKLPYVCPVGWLVSQGQSPSIFLLQIFSYFSFSVFLLLHKKIFFFSDYIPPFFDAFPSSV